MFLESEYSNNYLKDVIIAERSYSNNDFVKAGYQSITKIGASSTI
jgi:hypothetical protein